ncbi:MAG: 30S ribosomal protein S3 [Candidatus Woykebacteria bacterium RIFCSPHIGHO2_12_FULL_43_10]|uniref:Small ribosomal subunit protein uS3 n=2 Tax=Candidatus Woykeibacteriota TaxID=1817899 RepID=A0A1G1WY06_9BACT|nr:MAG: 30S ribosomal protein S3 [Candidatus Woykebacteria bacterium RIFCSPHIGHO2_01_FULL_43_29]OGY28702.1 MAG: 30S ribosomal protein S3 [Candidatus Woykebacteria bacterium RIFCSPHIGHO2_02_FULL_43_16b]OGY29777.1 MAG: 30S ribosomal protein S3 [Candidatus Woykebacteria bacterium RIFCSPHIGHO2_12_FULL_43_10]OGY32451.1 MAG: 30S ribosomal protein S3 [Candidatus Woykebacteria bacterium RIFCSPLOWO2_01_FULL_43_14]
MGQKVNPNAYRLSLKKNWLSRWFADGKRYRDYLLADLKIREAVMSKLVPAGVAEVTIERSGNQTTVNVSVSRPGMVIGRAGTGVEELKKFLAVLSGGPVKLEVKDIKNPDVNAYLVAKNVATQIERRYPPKRAINQAVDRAMRAGAKGVKILISGRIGGAEIARREKAVSGTIPLSSLRADIDYASVAAKTPTAGVLGVKVWVYKGEEIT